MMMKLPGEILALLSCPECRAGVRQRDDRVECSGDPTHRFPVANGLIGFSEPILGRYDDNYAATYAALWAYGHETIQSGQAEPLYRTVASLIAEIVMGRSAGDAPVIVDCGCGVGRSLADCHRILPEGLLIGLDGSPSMLRLAERIVCGSEEMVLDLSSRGHGTLRVPGHAVRNAFFFQADINRAPVRDTAADLVLCINSADRSAAGPAPVVGECARMLRPGGSLILTDPMNWQASEHWRSCGQAEAVRALVESSGLRIETWFDDLPYRELVDARGSATEYRTLVIAARKTEG